MQIERPVLLKPRNIYFDIYKYIWLNKGEKCKLSAKVADTVLFLDDIPILWVFTAKNGTVKRKNPKKMNTTYIKKYFLDKSSEIIGHYIYSSEENREITFQSFNEAENIEHINLINDYFEKLNINLENKHYENNKLNFEILDREKFVYFITDKKKRCGVFQSYVLSNNYKSFMYRIFWSPNFSICDVRNAKYLLNKNMNLLERDITFETDKINIETSKFILIKKRLSRFSCGRYYVNVQSK